jgi:hypothetical protein
MLYPITFSIPQEKIIKFNPNKIKILSDLIPGNLSTYIYENEKDYYNEYQISYFAKTTKKGGWDCLRHYEIIANGCVPYFPNIEDCPEQTLYLFPKDLIIEGNILYKKFIDFNITNSNIIDSNIIDTVIMLEYNNLIKKLLSYLKQHLTTTSVAKYILNKINIKNVKKILYLSSQNTPDYLRSLTLHGFKSIFGSNCYDYPKINYIYKSNEINYNELYGKGITYTNLLEQNYYESLDNETVINNINNKLYDIIIYGSYYHGMPFYDLVNKIYSANQIILLCGEDIRVCDYNIDCDYKQYIDKGYTVFIREL